MGILNDTLSVIRNNKDIVNSAIDTGVDIVKKNSRQSIARQSKAGICQFPVVASNSLDMQTLMLVSKALEKEYALMLQEVMNINNTMNVNSERGILDYISRFHQNAGFRNDFNQIAGSSLKGLRESSNIFQVGENIFVEATICIGNNLSLVSENRGLLEDPMESFEESILNNKSLPRRPEKFAFGYRSQGNVTEAYSNYGPNTVNDIKANDLSDTDHVLNAQKMAMNDQQLQNGRLQHELNIQKKEMNDQQLQNGRLQHDKDVKDINTYKLPSKTLQDNDVKKANELIPTSLIISVNMQDNTGRVVGQREMIIGVKTTIHPVTSEEMVSNITSVSKGGMFNFLRWKTGEISFVKDLLLNASEIKDQVANRHSASARWFGALKSRARHSKIGSNTLNKRLLPNATIIMSQEEVDYIKEVRGFDIMDTSYIDKLMKEYFLLGFVIVDKANEIVHILYDGDGDFNSISFDGLQKQNQKGGSDIKDFIKYANSLR